MFSPAEIGCGEFFFCRSSCTTIYHPGTIDMAANEYPFEITLLPAIHHTELGNDIIIKVRMKNCGDDIVEISNICFVQLAGFAPHFFGFRMRRLLGLDSSSTYFASLRAFFGVVIRHR